MQTQTPSLGLDSDTRDIAMSALVLLNDVVERERIGREMTAEESAAFGRAFREEYDASLAQKAERNGWA